MREDSEQLTIEGYFLLFKRMNEASSFCLHDIPLSLLHLSIAHI